MKNKGIIILGSPASGKTTLIKELKHDLKDFEYLNQDILVEDTHFEFYNNPLKAAGYLYTQWLPLTIKKNKNFLLDTTGSNINTLLKIIDNKQYQFKAVVLYCNPIIAFIRNFSRDRKLPKQVLLERWLQVYSQIDEYVKLFGEDNIYIYETEYNQDELTITSFYNTFNDFLNNNPGAYDSTFKKIGTNYTKEELLKREIKLNKLISKIDNKLKEFNEDNNFLSPIGVDKEYIKEELNKWIN